MRQLNFKHTYAVFPCFFKRNLPVFIFDSEKSSREDATDFENPSVELVAVQKLGFFKYLVVWKIEGYLKEDHII